MLRCAHKKTAIQKDSGVSDCDFVGCGGRICSRPYDQEMGVKWWQVYAETVT